MWNYFLGKWAIRSWRGSAGKTLAYLRKALTHSKWRRKGRNAMAGSRRREGLRKGGKWEWVVYYVKPKISPTTWDIPFMETMRNALVKARVQWGVWLELSFTGQGWRCCHRTRLSDSNAKIGSSNDKCIMVGFLVCMLPTDLTLLIWPYALVETFSWLTLKYLHTLC